MEAAAAGRRPRPPIVSLTAPVDERAEDQAGEVQDSVQDDDPAGCGRVAVGERVNGEARDVVDSWRLRYDAIEALQGRRDTTAADDVWHVIDTDLLHVVGDQVARLRDALPDALCELPA